MTTQQLRWILPTLLLLTTISVNAAIQNNNLPLTLNTNQTYQFTTYLRAENNYSKQYITITITTDNNGLLNHCNGTYQQQLSINNNTWTIIKLPLLYTNPGTYNIKTNITNTKTNTIKDNTITITGLPKTNNNQCPQQTGKRTKHYGYYDNQTVKNRLLNTTRKYSIF